MSLPGGLGELLSRLLALDSSLSARLTLTEEAGWWRAVAVLGAHLGDGPLWFVIALIAFGLGNKATRQFVLLAAVTAIVAVGLTTVLKLLIRRSRPREAIGFYSTRYDRHSFPSGHATRVACLAMIFSHQFPCCTVVFYALALFVVLCRVALGIHYISDVLVGLVIGFLASWVIISIW
ncbi:MAG TPA: phosphatase PAP2 family protein [Anaerolineae bacterium]|nr:phosphatase PAP2 family protein [Anaerolineae bacterium]